jgi:hypothetical protein
VIANGIASRAVDLSVAHRFQIDPHLVESWNFLLGSLADGPLWAFGPHGPVPVDPWGPKIVKEAEAARAALLSAMKTLQQIGARVVVEREKVAQAVAPSQDPELQKLKSRSRAT